jgi:hypothetical protein
MKKKYKINLEPVRNHFGSIGKAAIAIGYTSMAGTQWKARGFSPEVAVEIAEKSDGNVKPSDIIEDFKWW